jgi:hypothetical protein
VNNFQVRSNADKGYIAKYDLTCIEDNRLSSMAKAIHVYGMSRPKGWKLRIENMMNHFAEKRDKLYKAIKELEDYGYLKREQIRSGGKFVDWNYIWYEQPNTDLPDTVISDSVASPNTDLPDTVISDSVASPNTDLPDPATPNPIDRIRQNRTHSIIPEKNIPKENIPVKTSSAKPSGLCGWCEKPQTATTGGHYLLQKTHDLYRERFGECPVRNIKRDGKLLTALTSQAQTEPQILEIYRGYLTIQDDWFNSHGWDIPTFSNQYQGIKNRLNTKQQPSPPSNNKPSSGEAWLTLLKFLRCYGSTPSKESQKQIDPRIFRAAEAAGLDRIWFDWCSTAPSDNPHYVKNDFLKFYNEQGG